MAGKKGQKKRFWADEEKRSICEQALVPGVSVAQVARRYSMNANLIFKWLKDPRRLTNQVRHRLCLGSPWDSVERRAIRGLTHFPCRFAVSPSADHAI